MALCMMATIGSVFILRRIFGNEINATIKYTSLNNDKWLMYSHLSININFGNEMATATAEW